MLQLTPKTLKAQVIVWDAERETFEKIQKLVKVECVIENQMPPAKLKVFLPTGQTAFVNYGDVIGRDEADELVIISSDEVEKHYDISTIDLLDAIGSKDFTDAVGLLDAREAGGVPLAPNQEELEPEITVKPAKEPKKK